MLSVSVFLIIDKSLIFEFPAFYSDLPLFVNSICSNW